MSVDERKLSCVRATVRYQSLTKTEVWENQDTNRFSVLVDITDEKLQKLKVECMEAWMAYQETDDYKAKVKNRKIKNDAINMPVKEDSEGNEYVKMTMTHIIEYTKGGKTNTFEKNVPVYDGHCKNVPKKIVAKIGKGSIINLTYELAPYFNNVKNYGVLGRIVGIQIIKYVEYTGEPSPEKLGFEDLGDQAGFDIADVDMGDDQAEGQDMAAPSAEEVPPPEDGDF